MSKINSPLFASAAAMAANPKYTPGASKESKLRKSLINLLQEGSGSYRNLKKIERILSTHH